MKKKCSDCKKIKNILKFYKRDNPNNDKTYYKSMCKECSKDRMKKWRKENLDRFRKYQREYHRKKI